MGSQLFLFMEVTSTISLPSYREQDCTREHSDGINGKLQVHNKNYLLTISDSFVRLCQYTCFCGISEYVSPERIWKYLVFDSRCSTDGKTYSLSFSEWCYLLTDSANGNMIFFIKSNNKFKVFIFCLLNLYTY